MVNALSPVHMSGLSALRSDSISFTITRRSERLIDISDNRTGLSTKFWAPSSKFMTSSWWHPILGSDQSSLKIRICLSRGTRSITSANGLKIIGNKDPEFFHLDTQLHVHSSAYVHIYMHIQMHAHIYGHTNKGAYAHR